MFNYYYIYCEHESQRSFVKNYVFIAIEVNQPTFVYLSSVLFSSQIIHEYASSNRDIQRFTFTENRNI